MDSAPSWTVSLTDEMREELRRLHQVNPWRHIKILVLFGIWFGCAIVAVRADVIWIQLCAWVLIGFALHGLGVFMHEGAHECLFQIKLIDRTIGFLCGLPIFFSCSNYRATHLLHHRYENSAMDPDNLNANVPNIVLRRIVYYGWYLVGMFLYIPLTYATGVVRAEGRGEKTLCIVELMLIVALHGVLFYLATVYGWWHVLLNGWLLAIPIAAIVANVRGLAEHTMLQHDAPPDPLRSTRTTLSHPIVSFLFNNQNYHLEHHLFPNVPWYNLPRVHKVLKPIYEQQKASVARGYSQYLTDAIRYGPLKNIAYAPDHQSSLSSNTKQEQL